MHKWDNWYHLCVVDTDFYAKNRSPNATIFAIYQVKIHTWALFCYIHNFLIFYQYRLLN